MITIDDYLIDMARVINRGASAEVTAFPVEDGGDITDHVRILPEKVSIEGVVSDTPIGEAAVERAGSVQLPSEEARDKMNSLFGKIIKVITPNRVYRKVTLESLTEVEDASTGDAYKFTATFCEVRLVTNERTVVQVAVPRNSKKVNKGSKAAETVAPATVPPRAVEGASKISKTFKGSHYVTSTIPGQ